MIWELIFWGCLLALLHTYLFYPLLLFILGSRKKNNEICYTSDESLPAVSVLLSVYNEEEVISDTLESILKSNYPPKKLEIIVGSDGSDDDTNAIIQKWQEKYNQVKLFDFKTRRGKTNVLNDLKEKAQHDIVLLTDANVLFEKKTVYELVKHFKNPAITLVAANISNIGLKKEGISVQEYTYIQQENRLKFLEGKLWGSVMGAFGACYAVRKAALPDIPSNHLMEDFYITLHILDQQGTAISEPAAICYEDVSNQPSEEFRRKARISAGNFQNLSSFHHLLWPPFNAVSFSFWSHKVLRWFGPFALLLLLLVSFPLAEGNKFYLSLLLMQCTLFFVPLIDFLLRKINVHLAILRFISHFYLMNLALFIGFFKYLKGIETNVWQPTKRHQ